MIRKRGKGSLPVSHQTSNSFGNLSSTSQRKSESSSPPRILKVAELRDRVGLTQEELAEKIGVTKTAIANWEQDRTGTDWIDRLVKLCKIFNCQPRDLVELDANDNLIPKIDKLRERAGLSQRALGREIGGTATTIANWERGNSGLDWIERLILLCEALNCNVEDLIEYPHGIMSQNIPVKKLSVADILRKRV